MNRLMFSQTRSRHQSALLVVFMLVAAAHAIAVWGQPSLFWGDIGRWLHEIDRFASGEVLFRDFYWPFPPLSLWIVGGLARLLGSDLQTLWLITSAIYLAVCAAYFRFASSVISGSLLPLVLLSGLLLAAAQADKVGAPLPLGAYTPAAPVGALFLLLATNQMLRFLDQHRSSQALLIGALCGACVLTKQDFWPPSAFLILVVWYASPRPLRRRRILESSFAAGLVTLVGAAKIVMDAGAAALLGVVTGFGQVSEFGGLSLPTWERLTLDLAMASLLAGVVLACFLVAGRQRQPFLVKGLVVAGLLVMVTTTVYVWANHSVAEHLLIDGLPAHPTGPERRIWDQASAGGSVTKEAVKLIRDRSLSHIPALIFPVALFGMGWTRGRSFRDSSAGRTALILVALCIAARARRSFSGVDWFHFLLEIPVYVATIPLFIGIQQRQATRALSLLMSAVLLGAGYSYWNFASGPLTRSKPTVRVETARGVIHINERAAADFEFLRGTMDTIDPARVRPVHAFGYSGGLNYFLGRPNPSPATQGYRLSCWDPTDLLADLRSTDIPPFLVDNRSFQRISLPSTRLRLDRWDFLLHESPYTRIDRPIFERLIDDCPTIVGRKPASDRPFFTVFDCEGTWKGGL